MKIKFGLAAGLLAGVALASSPVTVLAAGGFHGGGAHGSFHGAGAFHGGGFRGGGFRGGWGGRGYWGWGYPFYWGGVGFIAGYSLAPYWYDDCYYGPYYACAPAYGAPPPPAAAPAGPPPGYDCDGWRWDATQQRYVAAKVACN
jgi:hypothetical protein